MKTRCIVVWRDDTKKKGKHQKPWNQTWGNMQRWWWVEQNLFLLFSWRLTVGQRDWSPNWRFLFGFLFQSPFQTAICTFLSATTFLGLVCRSSWINRTLKPELQMGSQGEERESRPFLNNSPGKVHYCAHPCLESRKLFQFCIFLSFSSCCLL